MLAVKLKQIKDSILQCAPHVLVLKLTVIFLLLYDYAENDFRALSFVITFITVLMLLSDKMLLNRLLWWVVFAVMAVVLIRFMTSIDNHKYVIAYWTLACALSVGASKTEEVLKFNGRCLIGLAFLFAFVWKILAGEYIDGSFFTGTFISDDRFWVFSKSLMGMTADALQASDDLFRYFEIYPNPVSELIFLSASGLRVTALAVSYWTILIEGIIALTFLVPSKHGFFANRDFFLILFLITTYFIAPVSGFALILCIMGLANVERSRRNTRAIYIAAFFLLQLCEFAPDVKDYLLQI